MSINQLKSTGIMKRFVASERLILSNLNGSSFRLERKFSSEVEEKTSYIHSLGIEQLEYYNVGQVLKRAAEKFPDRKSLVSFSENSQITFAETLDRADRLASGLLQLGLTKGDRVAVWAPSYEFWYISKLALCRAGLICVAMNPAYQLPELDYSLKKVDVKAIIIPEEFRTQKYYEMLNTLLPSLKHSGSEIKDNQVNSLKNVIVYSEKNLPGAIKFSDLLKSSESDVAEIEKLQASISPDDGCNIQFTSGTTGHPKATLLCHFSLVNHGFFSGLRTEFKKKQRTICTNLPWFHVAGIGSIMSSLYYGTTLVMPTPHFHPEYALKAIVKEKCDVIFGIPSMFADMITAQKKLNLDLPEIEFSLVGAAICPPQLVEEAAKTLKIKSFRAIYGMTETSAVGFQSVNDEDSKLTEEYVGKVSEGIEVKVIDAEGNTVPFGQPGELCIRGYCTMLGYLGDEEKTKEALGADKWLKTGDQFILNENGYGKIIGRLKEMIIRGGENLFPREIEDFLNTHPNVLETHVIGIPDERMGEEVGAFIRLKDNSKPLTQEDVKTFCKGKIAHFKVPRYVVIVDRFPITTSGKVQKIKFHEFFAEQIKKLQ